MIAFINRNTCHIELFSLRTIRMKKIDIPEQKKIALDILLYFTEYCQSHGLKYFLAYGTLIGAIRHNGYIPWDDDIDVLMLRQDYEYLLNHFSGHPYYRIMSNMTNKEYGKLFAVINDTRTIKQERLTRKRSIGTVCVNIDIFPVDFLPDNITEQEKLLSKVRCMENKLACLTYAYGSGRTILSTLRKNIGIFIYRTLELLGFISPRKIVIKHKKLLSKFKNTHTAGCVANTGYNGIREFMPLKCFQEQIDVEFEGHILKAPKEYDLMLRTIYGDYMQLPPEEKRITHHDNVCYWKESYRK